MKRWFAPLLCLPAVVACAHAVPTHSDAILPLSEIDVQCRPKQGQRIVQRVTKTAVASGQGAESVPLKERSHSSSETITADYHVGPDHIDLRFSQDGQIIPVSLRLSKNFELERIILDNPTSLTEQERSALEKVLEKVTDYLRPFFKQASALCGHWKPGESRVVDLPWSFPGPLDIKFDMSIRATFLRVVLLHGRQAAEFAMTGTGHATIRSPGPPQPTGEGNAEFVMTGTSWSDLETGTPLESSTQLRMDMHMEHMDGASGPEKHWYKPGASYTVADFQRDEKACTKGRVVDEDCLKACGWVAISAQKDAGRVPVEPAGQKSRHEPSFGFRLDFREDYKLDALRSRF